MYIKVKKDTNERLWKKLFSIKIHPLIVNPNYGIYLTTKVRKCVNIHKVTTLNLLESIANNLFLSSF